jgi:hypothetical protein
MIILYSGRGLEIGRGREGDKGNNIRGPDKSGGIYVVGSFLITIQGSFLSKYFVSLPYNIIFFHLIFRETLHSEPQQHQLCLFIPPT